MQAFRSTISKESEKWIKNHIPQSVLKITDIVATKAQGCRVWDTNNKEYLDLTCGIGVTSTGHCHPKVVSAIQQQAPLFLHAQQNIFQSHPAQMELVDKLLQICPTALDMFFFTNSGSEAVENAIKVARNFTGKPNIISFAGGFHGRTMGALSLTSSKTVMRQGLSPLMPGVFFAPFPDYSRSESAPISYTYARPSGGFFLKAHEPSKVEAALQGLEQMFSQQTDPSETAAIILEPILGEGGVIAPPPEFLQGLRRICDQHGLLLIFDEVQAGVGRTGQWWAHQFAGVQPDMMLFAKGIASGLPMAGIAMRNDLVSKMPMGLLGGTYGGNPIACAAASATLDVIAEEKLLSNTQQRGNQFARGLTALADAGYPIQDIRGRGLMMGLEFDSSVEKGTALKVSNACADNGLLLMTAGRKEVMRFLPPLCITEAETDEALSKLQAAFEDVGLKRRSAWDAQRYLHDHDEDHRRLEEAPLLNGHSFVFQKDVQDIPAHFSVPLREGSYMAQ